MAPDGLIFGSAHVEMRTPKLGNSDTHGRGDDDFLVRHDRLEVSFRCLGLDMFRDLKTARMTAEHAVFRLMDGYGRCNGNIRRGRPCFRARHIVVR